MLDIGAEWMADGACRDYPSDVFFPSDGQGVVIAQSICTTCPVITECLRYALDHHVDHGVWGGTSERERRRIARAERALARRHR